MCKLHLQVLKPLEHLIGVLVCPFAWDCAFHHGKYISLEIVAEVAERLLFLCASEEELAHDGVSTIGDGLCCGGHFGMIVTSLWMLVDSADIREKVDVRVTVDFQYEI